MNMYLTTIRHLYQIGFLKPKGIAKWIKSFRLHGQNLMSILAYNHFLNGNNIAIQDDHHVWTYTDLYYNCAGLQSELKNESSNLKKVFIVSHNNAALIHLIITLSSIGTEVVLLNADSSLNQIEKIIHNNDSGLIYADAAWSEKLKNSRVKNLSDLDKIILSKNKNIKISASTCRAGSITVMTGGSSGVNKLAQRKPSVSDYLYPFNALLQKMKIHEYKSIFLAIPIYHGFGLATVITALVLGSSIYITEDRSVDNTASILEKNKIEVVALVPTILNKLIPYAHKQSTHIKCIISGGAMLSENTIIKTQNKYGDILYNLYGTSEAGFCTLATPEDLKKFPKTIGRMINGVSYRIDSNDEQEVKTGLLKIHCKWMMNQKEKWVSTGDVVSINEDGYFFIIGRKDSMIVSGGENVFPEEIEQVCLTHEAIEDIAVVGVSDELYGQVLVAYVVTTESLSEIQAWMKSNLARYQLPKTVIIREHLPYLQNGKINKRMLADSSQHV